MWVTGQKPRVFRGIYILGCAIDYGESSPKDDKGNFEDTGNFVSGLRGEAEVGGKKGHPSQSLAEEKKMRGGAREEEEGRPRQVERDERLWGQRDNLMTEIAHLVQSLGKIRQNMTENEEFDVVHDIIMITQRMHMHTLTTRGGRRFREDVQAQFHQMSRPKEAAELMAQNLSMTLVNPTNRSFGNAVWRIWCWLPVYKPEQAYGLWGQTTMAVEKALQMDETVDMLDLPTLEPMWQWFPPDSQADAADFAHSLVSLAQTQMLKGQWWKITNYGALEEKTGIPIDIEFNPGEADSLEALITVWTNRDKGQYLKADQEMIILQIGRFAKTKKGWTKHHERLKVDEEVMIPASRDGVKVYKEYYRVAGVVLYHGEEHKSGHYTAILYYNDVMWWVDDEQPAIPQMKLTEQQEKEIFQVWLVRQAPRSRSEEGSSQEEAPEEDEAEERPTKKRKDETVNIAYCNVTSMSKEVHKWLASQQGRPLFLAETHLAEKEMEIEMQKLAMKGWRTIGMDAKPIGNGGNSGGIMLVYPTHLHIHSMHQCNVEGHGWLAVQWRMEQETLNAVGVYFKCGEGIQGKTNAKIWGELTAWVRHLQQPVIILGDYNIEPEELANTHIPTRMEVDILATGEETTQHGAELDWSLISRRYKPIATISTCWDVPCRPHAMIEVQLHMEATQKPVWQLCKYPAMPRLQKKEKAWEKGDLKKHMEFMGIEMDEMDKEMAKWAQRAEEYGLQEMPGAKKGRGSIVKAEFKPLQPMQQPWTWRRGAMAYWGQMTARMQQIITKNYCTQKSKAGMERLLWVMEKHWQGPDGCQELQDRMWNLLQEWETEEGTEILKMLEDQEQKAKEATLAEESEQYRQWLQAGYTKGYRSLFRCLKKDTCPFLRPFQDAPLEDRMTLRMRQWDEIWQIQQAEVQIRQKEEIILRGIQHGQAMRPIGMEKLKKIARSLPQKAAGIDGITNDLLRQLPDEGLWELRCLFHQIEQTGQIPKHWQTSLLVMIPKNPSIERPIALVATTYRLWTKVRSEEIKAWQSTLQIQMPWERAIPGN